MTLSLPAAIVAANKLLPGVTRHCYSGVIVPYVRVGRERWTPRAKAYFASKEAIQLQVKAQMKRAGEDPIPPHTPFTARLRFERHNLWTCDIDNLAKAVLDALNGIAYPDDRWCDRLEVSKTRVPNGADFVYIELEVKA